MSPAMPTPGSTRLYTWIAGSLAFVTLGLTLLGFVSVIQDSARLPIGDPAWHAAASYVREHAGERDAVRVVPDWSDASRMGLDQQSFSLTTRFDDFDRALFDRVWWIGADAWRSQTAAELDRFPGAQRVWSESGVSVDVADVPNQGWRVVLDGYRDLAEARVSRVPIHSTLDRPTAPVTECTLWLDGRSWHCGRRDAFVYVGRVTRELDDELRRAVYANPPGDGQRWRIAWEVSEPVQQLRLRAGNTLWALRHFRGSNVHMEARINGHLVARHVFEPDDFGFPEFQTTLPPVQLPAEFAVEIWADDPLDRFFCFRPQLLTRAGTTHADLR